jgi:hypothetical protein
MSTRQASRVFLVLLSLLVPTFASAQANPESGRAAVTAPVVKDVMLEEPKQGSLAAEIGLGVLGDLVSMGVSAAAVLPTIDITDDYGEDDSEDPMYRAVGLSLMARPLLVGSFTALGGHVSRGNGRAGISILGAVPGTLMLGAGWFMMSRDHEEAGAVTLVVGHLATIGGSVAAYRYSARQRVSRRMERALRYAPSPMVDRQRGVAGLSLSGSF